MLKMFLVTGGGNDGDQLDSTEIYDPDFGRWTAGAALPSKRSALRTANIDGRVLFFGINILSRICSYKRPILYLQGARKAVISMLSWSMTSLLTPSNG